MYQSCCQQSATIQYNNNNKPFEVLHLPVDLIHFSWINVFWKKNILWKAINNIIKCNNFYISDKVRIYI